MTNLSESATTALPLDDCEEAYQSERAFSDMESDDVGEFSSYLLSSIGFANQESVGNGTNGKNYSRKMSVKELKILRSEMGLTFIDSNENRRSRVLTRWRMACSKVLQQGDPWEKFHLETLPMESAKRYRYNALKCQWLEDIVRVKVDTKTFGRGAMRECFRAKKLSNFCHTDDWHHASNFVAKRFIEPVTREVYFDDVRLQMDAKLWGEEFSRQPEIARKVDIAQMCVLEFVDRPDKPLYHLEHYLEGTYRKYNSNSGFVDDVARNTPQAFSHFTFEQSGHRLIVVDIQGVGDLWTDPQIHTADGKAYGDGNLGIRGMALFFHTHRCNPLCQALELGVFDLLPGEQDTSALLPHAYQSPLPPLLSPSSDWEPDSQNEDSGLLVDSCELSPQLGFGATKANPRSRRVHPLQRMVSYQETDTRGFIDPGDFCDPHSLPFDNPYHPLQFISPVLPGGSPLRARNHRPDSSPNSSLSSSSTSVARRRRPDAVTVNGVHTSFQTSYDSGVCIPRSACNGDQDYPKFDYHSRRRRHPTSESSSGAAVSLSQVIVRKDRAGVAAFDGNGEERVCTGHPLSHFSGHANCMYSSGSSAKSKHEADLQHIFATHRAYHRSSSVVGLHGENATILGLIHHEIARLHACGRLAPIPGRDPVLPNDPETPQKNSKTPTENGGLDALAALHPPENINWNAVIFHEEQAATLQCSDAVECLAQYYLNLPINGPLDRCPISPDASEAHFRGLSLISTAASSGDRSAMLYLADTYYTGCPGTLDPSLQSPDWLAAVHWYEEASKVLDSDDPGPRASDTDGDLDDENASKCRRRLSNHSVVFTALSDWPVFKIHGRLAEMYSHGGHGLQKDPVKAYELFESAADGATEALQGRLAMYYYDQAALLEGEES